MSLLMDYRHQPVLLQEVLGGLLNDPSGLYLDATLGLGGHAEAILGALAPEGRLLGLEKDPEAFSQAQKRLVAFGSRFRAVRADFRNAAQVLQGERFFPLCGALFDLGVSSLQLDKSQRGFSFSKEGPLDMRMSPETLLTAESIVNTWPAEQLALLIKEYGEDPRAQLIARGIESRRRQKPFKTTTELADHIASLAHRTSGRHPATRTFQALRIAVNSELENLAEGLRGVLPFIKPGGRLLVISFHSLEDRIAKNLFASFVQQGSCRYVAPEEGGPLTPSLREVENNPRSRSAKLRRVEKL